MRFHDALEGLDKQDRKKVRETMQKIVENSGNPGLRPHPVGDFTSFSATMDLRILVLPDKDGDIFVHVDHHDAAYAWGERTKVIRDDATVLDLWTPSDNQTSSQVSPPQASNRNQFESYRFAALPTAIAQVLENAEDEDELLNIIGHLAPEYQEIALALAIDSEDKPTTGSSSNIVVVDDQILEKALEYPEEKWQIFLHPKQRSVIERPNEGHFLLKGGPGTGKTVCLVHRFARLSGQVNDKDPLFVAMNDQALEAFSSSCAGLGLHPGANQVVTSTELSIKNPTELAEFFNEFSAVLIDEGQDMPVKVISNILGLLEGNEQLPPLFIAYDANQAIRQPSGDALNRLSSVCDIQTLRYCYRNSREILDAASHLLSNLHNNYKGKDFQAEHKINASRDHGTVDTITAVSGPEVILKKVAKRNILSEVSNLYQELIELYPELVVIHACDDSKKQEELKKAIKETNPDGRIFSSMNCKGLEFRNGLVIDDLDHGIFQKNSITPNQYKLLSSLYVSLTRFRENVTYVSNEESPLLQPEA